MITALLIFTLFALGGAAFALGAGVITFTFGVLGSIAKGVFKLAGFLLMPFAMLLALFFGLGYLLPILVPVAVIILLVCLLKPKNA